MNDQIKALMGQTLDEKFAGTWSTMDMQDLTKFAEKFAELIVRECAQEAYDCAKQFCNDEHYRVDNLWPQFERVCNAVGDDIKIKFGVKE